jgi:hypothetical protein
MKSIGRTPASEANMNGEPDCIRAIRRLTRWADGYTLPSGLLILLLFTAVYLLLEQAGLGTAERTSAAILPGTVILAAATWQAVGIGVARVHMPLDGMDLETRSKRGYGPRTRQP